MTEKIKVVVTFDVYSCRICPYSSGWNQEFIVCKKINEIEKTVLTFPITIDSPDILEECPFRDNQDVYRGC